MAALEDRTRLQADVLVTPDTDPARAAADVVAAVGLDAVR